MKRTIKNCAVLLLAIGLSWVLAPDDAALGQAEVKPITLKTMSSLFFGGTVTKKPDGDTFHGDHGYAQFYIPAQAREYPLIMWHGMGQSGRSWESTPDGREGFQALLTRDDWPVYIVDQPRRGRAGYTQARSDDPGAVPTTARESGVWNAFRNGEWVPPNPPAIYPGVQFPQDAASIDQFFRQQTPNTGEEPMTNEYRSLMGQTMAALLEQTGPAILITHSNSGQYGWFTTMAAPDLVKAVVAYEPGAFVFPEGERPADIPAKAETVDIHMAPRMVPLEDFQKLTKAPILIVYGDNISTEPSEVFNVDVWRIASARAGQFAQAVNRHGGNATVIRLPEIGLKGNTHAPFADLNNQEIAAHLQKWLSEQKLDGKTRPHQGPKKKSVAMSIPLPQ
ncbi:hypothetical protein C4J81_16005 [Deltaproteobacteria bacterium Smac51]|nr:hypothetical protein C4J81_16005 [Deltaproteobacteria bacterium Smac51]